MLSLSIPARACAVLKMGTLMSDEVFEAQLQETMAFKGPANATKKAVDE